MRTLVSWDDIEKTVERMWETHSLQSIAYEISHLYGRKMSVQWVVSIHQRMTKATLQAK